MIDQWVVDQGQDYQESHSPHTVLRSSDNVFSIERGLCRLFSNLLKARLMLRSDCPATWNSREWLGNLSRSEKYPQSPSGERNVSHSWIIPKSATRSSVTKFNLPRVHWKEVFISSVRPERARRDLEYMNGCNCFCWSYQHEDLR